jgi:hypothetical protein
MRTQFFGKPLFFALAIGAACIAFGLGSNALSKGQAHQPAAQVVKVSATPAAPAQPIARDRTPSEGNSAMHDSWKRWPSLTDF